MNRLLTAVVAAGFSTLAACQAAAQDCRPLIEKLTRINFAESVELEVSTRPGVTYKSLFDDCDRSDTFAGKKLPRLQGMKQRCSTDRNSVSYIRKFADGTIVINAKMSVDADGSPVSAGPNASPADQAMTWLEFDQGSHRHFVNSEDVPFVVVPVDFDKAGISFQRDTGVSQGDLAVVVRGNRCSIGVVGDAGPYFRLGEASLRAHADLGNPQCATPGEYPCRKLIADGMGVSIPDDVTYILFPGTRPQPLLSQTVLDVTSDAGRNQAARFLSRQTVLRQEASLDREALLSRIGYQPQ
jgi:hypothetical protein